MKKINQSYIQAQLFCFAPIPLNSPHMGQITIQLRSERGKTNWLNIDAECAAKIESALIKLAERKDEAEAL